MKTILKAAGLAALLFSSAQAESIEGKSGYTTFTPKSYFSLGIGAFSIADDEVTFPDFNASTTNDIDTGVALYGLIGRRMQDSPLSIEGEIGVYTSRWNGFEDGSVTFTCPPGEDCLDEVIRTTSFTANAVLSAPMDAPVRPYIGVGGGLMVTDYNLDDVDAETGFGYIIKGGADVAVSGLNRVGVQYTYLGAPTAEFDDGFAEFDVSGHTFLLQWTSAF